MSSIKLQAGRNLASRCSVGGGTPRGYSQPFAAQLGDAASTVAQTTSDHRVSAQCHRDTGRRCLVLGRWWDDFKNKFATASCTSVCDTLDFCVCVRASRLAIAFLVLNGVPPNRLTHVPVSRLRRVPVARVRLVPVARLRSVQWYERYDSTWYD